MRGQEPPEDEDEDMRPWWQGGQKGKKPPEGEDWSTRIVAKARPRRPFQDDAALRDAIEEQLAASQSMEPGGSPWSQPAGVRGASRPQPVEPAGCRPWREAESVAQPVEPAGCRRWREAESVAESVELESSATVSFRKPWSQAESERTTFRPIEELDECMEECRDEDYVQAEAECRDEDYAQADRGAGRSRSWSQPGASWLEPGAPWNGLGTRSAWLAGARLALRVKLEMQLAEKVEAANLKMEEAANIKQKMEEVARRLARKQPRQPSMPPPAELLHCAKASASASGSRASASGSKRQPQPAGFAGFARGGLLTAP